MENKLIEFQYLNWMRCNSESIIWLQWAMTWLVSTYQDRDRVNDFSGPFFSLTYYKDFLQITLSACKNFRSTANKYVENKLNRNSVLN